VSAIVEDCLDDEGQLLVVKVAASSREPEGTLIIKVGAAGMDAFPDSELHLHCGLLR
jgi:hypothetical protein